MQRCSPIYNIHAWKLHAGRLLLVVLICPYVLQSLQAQQSKNPFPQVRFDIEVEAVLAKAGCNMGACHGNLNGKGGFRLSLRGQSPHDDYQWLMKEYSRRRLNLLEPDQSLILLKPISAVSHQGGTRFRTDSLEYSILSRWLQAGAPGPDENEVKVTDLVVLPEDSVVRSPKDSIQLRVTAYFSDGSTADVTSLAVYEPSNLVAEVSAGGLVHLSLIHS